MLNELDEEEEQLVAIAIALATSGEKTQTNVINAERDSLGEFHHLFPSSGLLVPIILVSWIK